MHGREKSEADRRLSVLQGWVTGGLAFIVVTAVLSTVVMLWLAYRQGEQSAQLKSVARTTHSALCTFKGDLVKRRDALKLYLESHPQEVIMGVPRGTFQQSLDQQNSTIRSLIMLQDCE